MHIQNPFWSKILWRSDSIEHITAAQVQTHMGWDCTEWVGGNRAVEPEGRVSWGRREMRHIIVATTMLVVALGVTFAAASLLQGVAVANGRADNEPYAVVEAAKSPVFMKTAGGKERLTSQFRDRGTVQAAAQFGL